MEAITAGTAQSRRTRSGTSQMGTSHGRPDVVANCSGTLSERPATPCAVAKKRPTKIERAIPMVGAKLAIVLRSRLVNSVPRRRPASAVAVVYVVEASTSESSPRTSGAPTSGATAAAAGAASWPEMSLTASTTKMSEIRSEKTSSVKRLMYSTKLDSEKSAQTARMADVQSPTQAYTGRNGSDSATHVL